MIERNHDCDNQPCCLSDNERQFVTEWDNTLNKWCLVWREVSRVWRKCHGAFSDAEHLTINQIGFFFFQSCWLWYTTAEQDDALQFNKLLDMETKTNLQALQWIWCLCSATMLFDQATQHGSLNYCSSRVVWPVWTKWYFVSLQHCFPCRSCNKYFSLLLTDANIKHKNKYHVHYPRIGSYTFLTESQNE
jgi:hypothetical protein